jgi:hypothetical protein
LPPIECEKSIRSNLGLENNGEIGPDPQDVDLTPQQAQEALDSASAMASEARKFLQRLLDQPGTGRY